MKNVKLFQIYYDEASRRGLDPDFIPLDNSANLRPDWYEYWPIRQALLNQSFGSDDYLGFFSPSFGVKSGCTGRAVMDAVNRSNADVLSFSPFLDQSSLYLNPFEQGNEHHPGLLDNAQKVVERLGLDVKLSQLVCDHTTTIFCNYFVARYEVWKTWLALGEQLFAICEDPNDALGVVLSRSTTYRNEATTPMKVFLAERLITLVLEKSGLCARPCLDLEIAPLGIPGAGALMGGLLICDALKGQFRKTGQKIFMDNYQYHRREICNRLANNNGRQP